MKIDGNLGMTPDVDDIRGTARRLEQSGFDGAWAAETSHEPFLPLAVAAAATERIELGTGIAIAFARTPMLLAGIGWNLQSLSRGRFILGLGSQIKPHITKRFSMPWSHPAARMREMVAATRAIWDNWLDGTPLDFRGDFYTHTLMTPFFRPDRDEVAPYGPPRIFLAAVGERMTEVAGEVCDGLIVHSFTTERYLREITLPAVERGRARAGKTMEDFEISGPSFVVSGTNPESMAESAERHRAQIAFYASTPAYRGVLDLHGWGDLQPELNTLSKQQRWDEMGGLIDDEILSTFAVVAEPEDVAGAVLARYGDVVSRLSLHGLSGEDPETWMPVLRAVQAG